MRANSDVAHFNELLPAPKAEESRLEFRENVCRMSTSFISESESAEVIHEAAQTASYFHPDGVTVTHGQSNGLAIVTRSPFVPLSDPTMKAMRKAFKRTGDGGLKYNLAAIYCANGLGGPIAYDDLFKDRMYMIAVLLKSGCHNSAARSQAFHNDAWKAIPAAPRVGGRVD